MQSDYLVHYGVKGMKWGVRNDIDQTKIGRRFKNIATKGWKKGHAQNVYDRLSTIENQSSFGRTRGSRMNARQRQSLKNARTYWGNRAQGKATPSRNIITRFEDDYRSYSSGNRIIGAAATNLGMSVAQAMVYKSMGANVSIGKTAVNSIKNSATASAGNEIVNKMFGHY